MNHCPLSMTTVYFGTNKEDSVGEAIEMLKTGKIKWMNFFANWIKEAVDRLGENHGIKMNGVMISYSGSKFPVAFIEKIMRVFKGANII